MKAKTLQIQANPAGVVQEQVLDLRTVGAVSDFANAVNAIQGMARFSSSLDATVVGGFSKLMKAALGWSKAHNFSTVLTYEDCRFRSRRVYSEHGFSHLGKTKPNYFYEKNGCIENRFSHRKNNNPTFVAEYGNSEREQNNNRGWYTIYDAGNEIFILNI